MAKKVILEAELGGTPLTPEQLGEIPDFADIRPKVWEKFPGAIAKKTFRSGEILFEEGDHGTTAFYLVSGELEIYLQTPIQGLRAKRRPKKGFLHSLTKLTNFSRSEPDPDKDQPRRTHIPVDGSVDLPIDNPVATLQPGDLFGEMTALASYEKERVKRAKFYPRSATVRAKTDVEVLEMLPHILNNVLYASQKFKQKLADAYRTRSIDHHLRSVPIFQNVGQDFIEYLRDRVELVDCTPGEQICGQGDIADAFYLIRLGFVKVSQSFAGGEMVLTYLSRGSYFGEIGLLPSAFRIRARGEGPGEFAEAIFSVKPLTCGRDPGDSGLKAGWDDSISREHFEVRAEGRRVRVTQLPTGKNRITYRMQPTTSFLAVPGDTFVVGDTTFEVTEDREQTGYRTATCTAVDHVQLVRITAEDFQEMVSRFPDVAIELQEGARSRRQMNAEIMNRIQMVSVNDFLTQELMQGQDLLLIDLEKCTRCDECVKACIATHEDGTTRLLREGLRFDKYLVPTSCRACMDPLCMTRCPVGSIRRRGSLDIVIEDWCIGCGNCAVDCPYGNINIVPMSSGLVQIDGQAAVPQKAEISPKAVTCDLCVEYDAPNCVRACPHEAALRVEPKSFFAHDLAGMTLAVVDQPTAGPEENAALETVVLTQMADLSAMLPRLRVRSGPRPGRILQLKFPETSFGRGPENDHCFESDTQLSRRHCVVVCGGGRFLIRDNDSTNGSFVNGNRVAKELELRNGDVIRIGEMEMEFLGVPVQ